MRTVGADGFKGAGLVRWARVRVMRSYNERDRNADAWDWNVVRVWDAELIAQSIAHTSVVVKGNFR